MKFSINPAYFVIAVLVVIIVLQRACHREVDCPECPTFDTSAFVATLPIDYNKDCVIYKPQYYPVYEYRDTGSTRYIPVPSNIDSLAVVEAYFTRNVVQDTIINDSNAFIVINDVVWMNEIQTRLVFPKVIRPHLKTVTKTVFKPVEPRTKVYIGFTIGAGLNQFGAGAGALLQTKRDHVYGLTYDPFNKYGQFSVYWKIKLRKNDKN